MKFGMLIGDVPREVDPLEQLDGILRQVEAGQRNGLSHFVIGHHFLYGDLRWLQPIPLLARLAGEIDEHVRLGMSVLLAPLYNPIVLAEELATLDIVTRAGSTSAWVWAIAAPSSTCSTFPSSTGSAASRSVSTS